MKLTEREKEMLVMFGELGRKQTLERLGRACWLITDPGQKAVTCRLRYKVHEMDGKTYTRIYCRVKEEWNKDSGDAA